MTRKDNRGRKLRTGESQRSDGRYCYRYTDKNTGKRETVYSTDLASLREKERNIQRDMEDGLSITAEIRKIDLNMLFEKYIDIRELAESTKGNYVNMWNIHIKDDLGKMKVVLIKPSHIKTLYARLSKAEYSRSTIKLLHNLLYPTFELAVEDDIIRKNPAKDTLRDYGKSPKVKEALSLEQQEKLFQFVSKSNIYNVYIPLLQIMIGTALRVGELIGLTWENVNLYDKEIYIEHQLIYKDYGDGYRLHVRPPKTEAGNRTIPMTQIVRSAFLKQKEYQFALGTDRTIKVEELSNFVFTGRNGMPIMPSAINNVLYNIVDAYNREEVIKAKKEKRKAVLMPSISAHTLRHTGCTRMAECGIDPKVLQYIMGHANIAVTMEIYNHITEKQRIEKEIQKLDNMKVI